VTLHLFELAEGAQASASIPSLDGATALTVTARRTGANIHVTAQGEGDWSLLLRGIPAVGAVEGGTALTDEKGTRIQPQGEQVTIRL
jgi:alpha-D-xyloside xylohydrolase